MGVPTGEVTFLFTDIEGSTALIHELGENYLGTLATHNELLRAVWAEHGGVEVKTEGDAFFVAFAQAGDAVSAAAAAQRRLATQDWAHGRPVRVRIGMHTGHAVVVDEDYVGLDVHEAARVGAAGHGGQVLLTEATLAAAGELDHDLGAHDLGLHRLKDFPTPRRLFQLTGPGLERTFGPPRTTTARSHNLRRPPTPLVGRLRELEVATRTVVGGARLVTITGAGGLGKTRLSLEVAWSVLGWFREGVWFVDLSSLVDAGAVPAAVARALALAERAGVEPFELLVEHFSTGPAVLVLDNLEQLLDDDAITVVSDLLGRCPDLTVLGTSRERLRLRGEHEIALDGMGDGEAVVLFEARATAADPEFSGTYEQVAKIARAVDGIPLALELAAARVRNHDPDELLAALHRALDVLTEGDRDLPTRHRTMRATVAWSWDLCDDEERDVLRALAVFVGDADLRAVEAVHGRPAAPLVDRLADRSMVVRRGERVGMLAPIRAFVTEQLTDAARSELEATHGRLYAGRAVAAGPHLVSSSSSTWLDRLDADALDLHAAATRLPAPDTLPMAGALVRWWVLRSRWSEGSAVLGDVLTRLGDEPVPATVDVDATALARVLAGAAELAVLRGRLEEATSLLARAARLPSTGSVPAWVANLQGEVARTAGDLDRADEAYERARTLATAAGDDRLVAATLLNAGVTAHQRANAALSGVQRVDEVALGWYRRARDLWAEAQRAALGHGDDLLLRATLNLATVDMTLGDPVAARAVFLEARAIAEGAGDLKARAQADANLGLLAMQAREEDVAEQHFRSALETTEQAGDVALQGRILYYWSLLLRDDGDVSQNLARARRSIALAERLGDTTELEQRRAALAALLERAAGPPEPQP